MIIQTFSGNIFDFDNISSNVIDPVDIIHALSNQCRWSGHTSSFLSVAQHSCNCFDVAISQTGREDIAAEALLHDAAEAYVVDVPRPIRSLLPSYDDLVCKVETVVMKNFGLPHIMSDEVKEIDNRMLVTEYYQLISNFGEKPMLESMSDYSKVFPPYSDLKIESWNSERSKVEFSKRMQWLGLY